MFSCDREHLACWLRAWFWLRMFSTVSNIALPARNTIANCKQIRFPRSAKFATCDLLGSDLVYDGSGDVMAGGGQLGGAVQGRYRVQDYLARMVVTRMVLTKKRAMEMLT